MGGWQQFFSTSSVCFLSEDWCGLCLAVSHKAWWVLPLASPQCDADASQQKTPLRHAEPGFPLLFSKAALAGDFVMIRDHKKQPLSTLPAKLIK